MHFSRILAAAVIILGPLCAQEADVDQRNEELLERAEIKAEAGRPRDAFRLLKRAIVGGLSDREALRFATRLAMITGEYADADEWSRALLKDEERGAEDVLLRVRVLARAGKVEPALEVLAPLLLAANQKPEDGPAFSFVAVAAAARLHESRGRDEQARILHDRLVTESKRVVIRDPMDLIALSHAYVFFGGPKHAERALVGVRRKDPEHVGALMALGDLYRHQAFQLPKNSVKAYRQVLKVRRGHADAHEGMGRAFELWMKDDKAETAYKRALSINPNHPDGLASMARINLLRRQPEAAAMRVTAVLKQDPQHREGLALEATLALTKGKKEDFRAGLDRILKLDPTFVRAFRVAGRALDRHWRWPEALELLREAAKLAPEDQGVHDDLAKYAFYLGLEEEGYAALRKADDHSPHGNVWRKNMWLVQRKIQKKFKEIQSTHFVHRVHESELESLGAYLSEYAENSYAVLSKKYNYKPAGLESSPGRILVEHFNNHSDFAVRTVGLKGLGIQGVCFGPFIAQDSPGAGIPGFSWYRTLHHEIAHTMTLGLSKGRIPRWLTEGLSTFEEMAHDPSWDRRMDRDLFDAYHTRDILRVLQFDAAFQSPRVMFAYFQAGVVCTMISEEFGFERILALLKAYGEGRSTADAIQHVLGISPKEFDDRFLKHVAGRIAPIKLIPRLSRTKFKEYEARADGGEPDLDTLVLLASALIDRNLRLDASELIHNARRTAPRDARLDFLEGRIAFVSKRLTTARKFFEKAAGAGYSNHDMHLMLAVILQNVGEEDGVVEQYRLALKTLPARKDAQDPRLALARLAEGAGDSSEAVRLREEHLALAFEDVKTRKLLTAWYLGQKDHANAIRHMQKLLLLIPQERDLHLNLGKSLISVGKLDDGLREIRIAAAVSEPESSERANAYAQLAQLLWQEKKDAAAARAAVEKALEADPDHSAAKKLLQQLDGERDR